MPETMVQTSNEEAATEDADDVAINNVAVETLTPPPPRIPPGLEVAEANEPETTSATTTIRTTTTTTEPTTTTVATSTVPMSECRSPFHPLEFESFGMLQIKSSLRSMENSRLISPFTFQDIALSSANTKWTRR